MKHCTLIGRETQWRQKKKQERVRKHAKKTVTKIIAYSYFGYYLCI